jgi:tripartite-type tricarboxylate transporter receptor subunit TctC
MFAPKDTPEPIVAKLRQEINKALAQPDTKEKFNRAGGLEPYISTPQEFAGLIRTDHAKFAKLVKDINLRVD